MNTKLSTAVMLAAAMAMTTSQPARAQDDAPPEPIVMGQVNLTFYTASAAVVAEVLERLGHPLSVTEGNHRDIYARLGKGEVDLLVAAWLPHAHGPLQAPMADRLVARAHVNDAIEDWIVRDGAHRDRS